MKIYNMQYEIGNSCFVNWGRNQPDSAIQYSVFMTA